MKQTKAGDWILKKVPFGIIAGASAIVAFYAIFGFVAAHIYFSQIALQTGDTVSMFQYGWQALIFVAIIIFNIIFAASLVMFILKKTLFKKRIQAMTKPEPTEAKAVAGDNAETAEEALKTDEAEPAEETQKQSREGKEKAND